MDRRTALTALRGASVLLVVAAIVAQAIELANHGTFDATRFFAFFTIQSNLVGVVALAWILATGDRPRSRALELWRTGAALYLTVTFVVVIVLLSGVDVQLQLQWVDFVLHKLFPVVVVADWLLDPPRLRFGARDALVWVVYPLAWIGLTMARGAADGWYPYPFLDPARGSYAEVAVTVVAITVGFLLLAAAAIALANARSGGARLIQPGT